MPEYRYEKEASQSTGYPNVMNVPPKGWPTRPFSRVYRHGGYIGEALAGVLSLPCRIARSLGGPCGCYASELVFGHSVRELWLANNWLGFPRTTPAAGMVAVWPHRHVAVIEEANGDGTVTVHDSWAVHRVSMRGLVIVDPHGGQGRFRSAYSM